MSSVSEVTVRSEPGGDLSLGELLDRLIGRGVALQGDLVLSVADVDLVWLGLKAVLAGADVAPAGAALDMPRQIASSRPATGLTRTRSPDRSAGKRPLSSKGPGLPGEPRRTVANRIELEEERVEEGLVRLVLSLVELLRQLMEGQAVRRMEAGALSDVQVEQLGTTLMRLSERMDEMKEFFGLGDDDLELRLAGVDVG